MDNIENMDNEKALELEADEGHMLNCIGQKILFALKFWEDNQIKRILRTHGNKNNKSATSSSESIVPRALVEVLGLSTEKHVAHYR